MLTAAILDELAAPYERPDLSGTGMTFRHTRVAYHGPRHEPVHPGRAVVEIPRRSWPAARPEACADDSGRGAWINDHVLVCRGCGLDCT